MGGIRLDVLFLVYWMNDGVKVLMFGWELPPHNSGGLGVACHGLAKGLSDHGVNISFALPRQMSVNINFMNILSHDLQGVEVTAINSLLQSYMNQVEFNRQSRNIREERLRLYGRNLYEEALRFGEMAASWSRSQPHHVIHTHDWMTYPAGMRAKRISGQPFVAHIHATEYDRTGGQVNTQIAELEYQGLHAADRVIAVSNYTKEVVNRYYGVPKEKVTVVHNGVDLNDFSPVVMKNLFPNDKIVLFVGRLTMQKGAEYLLRAAQKVLAVRPDTIFLMVGSGDLEHKLIMDAAYMGIGNKVVFPGFMKGDKLRACYQMADAFVMPSVSEPYGIVALEALAAGTPTIISNQSGVGENLTNVHKVDFWDTQKMAEKILTVLDYPGLAREMAAQAKMEAAEMTWQAAAGKVVQVYQELM
jgi:glycosyltransferase involved in cell wall biosynthesis